MKYADLQDLINHSSSTRQYFLTLPVPLQLVLHKYGSYIHTAADVHFYADSLQKNEMAKSYDHLISKSKNHKFFH